MSENHEHDAKLAIEVLDKIIASDDKIRALVERCKKMADKFGSPEKRDKRVVHLIIAHYSNMCLVGGGVSGLPGIFPVVGPIFAVLGAGAVDAIWALKFEIEMVLALSYFAGHDISDPRERKIAYLMACSSLEDAYDNSTKASVKKIIDLAISEYSTRELSKTMIKAVARAIMTLTAKRWTKYFPIVGMVIGASTNKVMTEYTGRICWQMIKKRPEEEES